MAGVIRVSSAAVAVLTAAALAVLLAGCATTQGRHFTIGEPLPPAASSADVQVFSGVEPERPFQRVCHINAHLEKTFFVASTLAEALPELKRQARLCGAEAIVDISQHRSMVGETKILNVTAIGIRFTQAKSQ